MGVGPQGSPFVAGAAGHRLVDFEHEAPQREDGLETDGRVRSGSRRVNTDGMWRLFEIDGSFTNPQSANCLDLRTGRILGTVPYKRDGTTWCFVGVQRNLILCPLSPTMEHQTSPNPPPSEVHQSNPSKPSIFVIDDPPP
jgi:hypothetical protein